jgi:hypothetical protein
MSEERYRSEIEGFIEEFERDYHPISPAQRAFFLSPERLQLGRSNLRVNSLRERSPVIRDALEGRGLVFARVVNPKKSLILASRPVVKVTGSGTTILSDERVQAWLPISPNLAVSPGYKRTPEYVVDLTTTQVRLMNLAFAEQSTQIVGRSRELIASLAGFVGGAINR